MIAIHLALAGAWKFIFHWGTGIGIIALCLIAAYASEYIPIIGTWLGKQRQWLIGIAIGVGIFMAGMWVGVRDEAARCAAKGTIIDHGVSNAIDDAHTPKADKAPDPYNSPEN